MEYNHYRVSYNLSLSPNKVKRWADLYKLLKQKQKEIFYLAKDCYYIKEKIEKDSIAAKQELEIFNNSIKQLKLYIKIAINYKLVIYNKPNQNTILTDFNLLLLDPKLSIISFSLNLDVDNKIGISSQSS